MCVVLLCCYTDCYESIDAAVNDISIIMAFSWSLSALRVLLQCALGLCSSSSPCKRGQWWWTYWDRLLLHDSNCCISSRVSSTWLSSAVINKEFAAIFASSELSLIIFPMCLGFFLYVFALLLSLHNICSLLTIWVATAYHEDWYDRLRVGRCNTTREQCD